jgi:hypothetical protein
MPLYGYARVSTIDQDLRLQRAALKAAGCDVIRAEKASGSRRDGRTELQVLLDFVQPGDALVVTRIDRLARSMKDLQEMKLGWCVIRELCTMRTHELANPLRPRPRPLTSLKALLSFCGNGWQFSTYENPRCYAGHATSRPKVCLSP